VTGWTDAHSHLQDRYVARDGEVATDSKAWEAGVGRHELEVQASLERAYAAGVDTVMVIGTDAGTSAEALRLVAGYQGPVRLAATVGLHPHDAEHDLTPIVEMAASKNPFLVGIGECGLDYYYEHSPREPQQRAFAAQIRLAHEHNLALVIHARDAWGDLFAILRQEGVPARTVIHCFTGGPDEAEACLALGCDISISGIVTFKNADDVRSAAKLVPLDRLHVETDSPFLAPVPHRGKANEPAFVSEIGTYLAELRNEPVELVRATTAANTARLFQLSV
jgi:TatD DNase family protein